ncbi:MAG: DsbA family protein [Lautropia sp.]
MNAIVPSVLEIDVVSDVVCPWCFVGKRQLDQAVAQWQQRHPRQPAPTLRWRPFQLNPDLPGAGMLREDYLLRKFGHRGGAAAYQRVRDAARNVGLTLALEAIRIQPNTLRCHGLIEVAAEAGCQTALVEALFAAYFLHGRDLSDDAVLREIAAGAGVPADLIDAVLNGDAVTRLVAAADAELREYGVDGVPLFLVGSAGGARLAVSGAQGSAALLEAFERAMAGDDPPPIAAP